jgi:NADH dehydrogenase
MAKNRVLILGGGFAGLYTALELERLLAKDPETEVTLVNRDNFFLFTPMLHEVAASDLDLTNIVNPVRKLPRKVQFFQGEVQAVDLERRRVTVAHGFDHHPHELEYDRLVLGLGSTTNFFGLPGLEENAVTMKTLADAINLRNRMIAVLEEAVTECCSALRRPLLTIVAAGGGFAGVETIAGLNDFLHQAIRYYPNLRPDQVRVVLVHPGPVILPELNPSLGRYAQKKLEERGVEIRLNCKVTGYDGILAALSDGEVVACKTLIWTAGTTPSMLLNDLPCEKQRGRLVVDDTLELKGRPGVWALGDCALIPDNKRGGFYPPTAQHALRQGRVVGRNIVASLRGGEKKSFSFSTIGQLAAIGRRTGVANILGVNFSGFIAWWLWRTIYLSKLPRFEKKLRVALDWTLDVLFSKDLVQFVNFRQGTAMAASRSEPARAEATKETAA